VIFVGDIGCTKTLLGLFKNHHGLKQPLHQKEYPEAINKKIVTIYHLARGNAVQFPPWQWPSSVWSVFSSSASYR